MILFVLLTDMKAILLLLCQYYWWYSDDYSSSIWWYWLLKRKWYSMSRIIENSFCPMVAPTYSILAKGEKALLFYDWWRGIRKLFSIDDIRPCWYSLMTWYSNVVFNDILFSMTDTMQWPFDERKYRCRLMGRSIQWWPDILTTIDLFIIQLMMAWWPIADDTDDVLSRYWLFLLIFDEGVFPMTLFIIHWPISIRNEGGEWPFDYSCWWYSYSLFSDRLKGHSQYW